MIRLLNTNAKLNAKHNQPLGPRLDWVAFLGGWLGAMQQLDIFKKKNHAVAQPPTAKDLSLTMPPHILCLCYVSRIFHWIGLGSTGMACVGCCACVCVLGGFHWKDNSNKKRLQSKAKPTLELQHIPLSIC